MNIQAISKLTRDGLSPLDSLGAKGAATAIGSLELMDSALYPARQRARDRYLVRV